MPIQDFQAKVQTIVQAIAQLAALAFLIGYGMAHDGAVADLLIPGFLGLAGINVLGSIANNAVHAYSTSQQARAAATLQAPPATPAGG